MSDEKRTAPNDLQPGSTGGVVANDFGLLKYAGGTLGTETTHHADPFPKGWCGRYITFLATGGNCHIGFSTSSSAEVDRAVAASNTGASVKVGKPLLNSIEQDYWVPPCPEGSTMYFVRESDTVGTIVYCLVSDRRERP